MNRELSNFNKQQFECNIGGMIWKSKGDGEKRKYDFDYDKVNRILSADFNQYTGSSFNKTAGVDFSMSNMSYDANGNIMSMNQKGLKINTSPLIDQLAYTYQTNSNKLSKVVDAVVDKDSKLGDFKYDPATKGSTDYSYDVNGNLTLDNNKKISSITYSYLNLPSVITVTGKGTITYTYDAAGNKLKKVTVDNTVSPSKTTTTLYLGGAVYENDVLQFVGHEEGRIRFKPAAGAVPASFAYDYFLKDHLGNVRMVLTEEKDSAFYLAATFEDANIATEGQFYDNVDVQRTSRPGAFYTSTSNGSKVQLLRKNVQSKGAGQLLKVMSGDKLHIKVDYYIPTATTDNSTANGLNTIIAALASIIDNSPATAALHGSGSTITTSLGSSIPFTGFLSPQNGSAGTTMPKAYLNIVFFDACPESSRFGKQFKFVSEQSEAVQVTTEGSGQTIYRVAGNAKEATKNGYVYIYVNNESNNLVYFDNLQVTHERGPILEETHYYPFGLAMAGISSKALQFGGAENRLKYNGKEEQRKEFSDGSGLEWTAMDFRNYDMQIGRFHSPDVLADLAPMQNPYRFAFNNPVFWCDPTGLYEYDKNGNIISNGSQEGEIKFIQDYILNNGTEGLMSALQNAGFALELEEIVIETAEVNGSNTGTADNINNDLVRWGMWGVNTGVGIASAYTVYKGAYLTSNELWHRTMTKPQNTYFRWSKLKNGQIAYNNPLIKRSQALQANKVSNIRGIGDKLTKAGAALLVEDIALSGELKPSHAINAAMLGASTTGVGAIAAGVWFLADFGTMGVNYLLGNEAKGLGDLIDESIGSYEMYKGVY